jgi:hypothetical protein
MIVKTPVKQPEREELPHGRAPQHAQHAQHRQQLGQQGRGGYTQEEEEGEEEGCSDDGGGGYGGHHDRRQAHQHQSPAPAARRQLQQEAAAPVLRSPAGAAARVLAGPGAWDGGAASPARGRDAAAGPRGPYAESPLQQFGEEADEQLVIESRPPPQQPAFLRGANAASSAQQADRQASPSPMDRGLQVQEQRLACVCMEGGGKGGGQLCQCWARGQ